MLEHIHTYDWFELDDSTICLSLGNEIYAVIKRNKNQYHLFQVFSFGKTGSINFVGKSHNLINLIDYVHSKVRQTNSYITIDVPWKNEPATAAQKQYAWGAETKWDVHIHFAKYKIGKAFEKYVHFDTDGVVNVPSKDIMHQPIDQ